MSSLIARPKFERYGGSKVRTGCLTCKMRRVKCDESREPDGAGGLSCKSCLKSRRTCGGYVPPPKRNKNAPLVMINYFGPAQSVNVLPGIPSLEQRSLEFFRTRTALETFSSHEWSEHLLRASHYDSAVRHAIVALSALHESFQSGHGSSESDFAMQQYGKAMNEVVKLDLSQRGQSTNIALITCILFASFESLQGHYKSALLHIKSGIGLLREEDMNTGTQQGYISNNLIRPFFLRFITQSGEIGDANVKMDYPSQTMQQPPDLGFYNVEDARHAMVLLLHHFMHFLGALPQELPTDIESLIPIIETHSALMERCQVWEDAFDKLVARLPSPNIGEVYILKIWSICMFMTLHYNIAMGEMAWDEHTESMRSIVTLAESFMKTLPVGLNAQTPAYSISRPRIVSADLDFATGDDLTASTEVGCDSLTTVSTLQSTSSYRPGFTLDLGLIQPLYVVCSRCRDPVIRRRALQLLATCNRKEGIWDSTLTARVAERIIAIEEGSVHHRPILHASQLPEHVRIHSLSTEFGQDRQAWIRYTKSSTLFGSDKFEEFMTW